MVTVRGDVQQATVGNPAEQLTPGGGAVHQGGGARVQGSHPLGLSGPVYGASAAILRSSPLAGTVLSVAARWPPGMVTQLPAPCRLRR